jgi:dTDP-4-amino-4,6-dideoxygalactose transaminase
VLSWKKEVYNYYRKHLDGIFQKIAESSNHNTIGILTSLKIPEHIETRKYYQPIELNNDLPNTEAIYRSIVCLPSWYGVDYKQIVNDINEFNKNKE